MHCGYELTELYQATPHLFGVHKSKSFAYFLQALALHENIIAQTFFRQLWMPPHTCIPPLLAEPPRVVSYSDSEDEEVDPAGLETRRARGDEIVFQAPSMAPVAPKLTRAEGKKSLIQKIRTPFLSNFRVHYKTPIL